MVVRPQRAGQGSGGGVRGVSAHQTQELERSSAVEAGATGWAGALGQAARGEPRDDKESFIFQIKVVTPSLAKGEPKQDSTDQEMGHPPSQDRMALDSDSL